MKRFKFDVIEVWNEWFQLCMPWRTCLTMFRNDVWSVESQFSKRM